MPEPTLQTTALRYAAGDLSPTEAAAFEAQLAHDQEARDALSEAVRLSAAAIGQKPLRPHPSFRALLRSRLNWGSSRGPLVWAAAGGATVAICTLVALSLAEFAKPVANSPDAAHAGRRASPRGTPRVKPQVNPPAGSTPLEAAPAPHLAKSTAREPHEVVAPVVQRPSALPWGGGETPRTTAEIWADLSTPENVEKARDDELRWRQKMRDLAHRHPTAASKADSREP